MLQYFLKMQSFNLILFIKYFLCFSLKNMCFQLSYIKLSCLATYQNNSMKILLSFFSIPIGNFCKCFCAINDHSESLQHIQRTGFPPCILVPFKLCISTNLIPWFTEPRVLVSVCGYCYLVLVHVDAFHIVFLFQ